VRHFARGLLRAGESLQVVPAASRDSRAAIRRRQNSLERQQVAKVPSAGV